MEFLLSHQDIFLTYETQIIFLLNAQSHDRIHNVVVVVLERLYSFLSTDIGLLSGERRMVSISGSISIFWVRGLVI